MRVPATTLIIRAHHPGSSSGLAIRGSSSGRGVLAVFDDEHPRAVPARNGSARVDFEPEGVVCFPRPDTPANGRACGLGRTGGALCPGKETP